MSLTFRQNEALQAARALLQADRPAEALTRLHLISDRLARDPAALDCAAMCYWQLGDGPTALGLMGVLTDGWPNLTAGWTKRASMAAATGDGDLAEACLKRALSLTPKSVPILAALNRVKPFAFNGSLTRRLRSLLTGPLSEDDRQAAANALARIEERAGRYSQAFRHFAAAKAAGGVAPPCQQPRPTLGEPPQTAGPDVVFVAGMPRSGTTLMEQILLRHPETVGIGESPALSRTATCACQEGLTGTQAQALYLKQLNLPPDMAGRVIVDKMPLNILDMEFALWCLPRARVVFMDRHPMDVGLSCYATRFHDGNGFSHRLDWIGAQIRIVHDAAGRVSGHTGFLRQSYRALVEAPEPQIRAVLRHLGLGFVPDCLSPEKGQGVVGTASMFQVRAPINQDGLGKWRNYAAQLEPLKQALGAEWLAGWEEADRAA